MKFIRKALVVLILSMAIVSGLAVVPFYGKVATVEAGIVGKAAKAYLSSRLIKAMSSMDQSSCGRGRRISSLPPSSVSHLSHRKRSG